MRRIHFANFLALVLVVVPCLGSGNAQAQSYLFGTANYSVPLPASSSPPSGNTPFITADFNGDGLTDLALLGSTSGSTGIAIILGKPDGTFAPPVKYPVSGTGMAAGDFNGDGKLDIIVVNPTGYPVSSILLGNGDGTFQAAATLNLGISNGEYSSVAAADLNGDKKLDLVLMIPLFGSTTTMTVLLGNGDGTFGTPENYTVPVGPYVSIGDFNRDGALDLAISGPVYNSSQPNPIAILMNNGNGTFQNPVQYNVTGAVTSLAVADLNGDHKLDLIAYTSGQSAAINVLMGMGDGTFGTPIVYTNSLVNTYGGSIAVADFDGDGKLDLAINSSWGGLGTYGVAILPGNGDGTFKPALGPYSTGLGGELFALDLNGDGKPDLAVWGSSFLTLILNQGNGIFPNRSTLATALNPYGAVSGDFNGDGIPDIAVDAYNNSQNGVASVFLGNGDGTFQPRQDTSVSISPTLMAAGDFNADGHLDLLIAGTVGGGSQGFFTLLGNGNGQFQSPHNQSTSATVVSLAVGDFNGDHKLDVAAAISNSSAVSIYLGAGNGTFGSPTSFPTGPTGGSSPVGNVLVGDFNNDSILDLAVSTNAGVSILLGKGDGTFPTYSSVVSGETLVAVGDFNGDGKPDLVLGELTSHVSVALGNGDGTFQPPVQFILPSDFYVQSGVVGDFNGDGKLDIAIANQSTDIVTILLGTGDGKFGQAINYAGGITSNNLDFVVAGDFNRDGALDLALASTTDSNIGVFLSSPAISFLPSPLNFGAQTIGVQSAPRSLYISNPGVLPVSVSGITVSGNFGETGSCITKLEPGTNCPLSLTFTPSGGGSQQGSLVVDNTAPGSPATVPLTGSSAGSAVDLSDSSLSFGYQAPNTTSTAKTVTMTNTGTASLAITSITAAGDFAQTNNCGSSLAINAACTINVTFTPTAASIQTGTITITDNTGNSPQTISLSGTGLQDTLTFSTYSLTFPGQIVGSTSTSQYVVVYYTGAQALTLTSTVASGDFTATNNCGGSLAPVVGECTIFVSFAPTAAGSRTGTVTVTDGSPGSPQTIAVEGTGEDFSLLVNSGSSSKTVTAGQTTTYSLTTAGLGGLSQTINFTCGGAPAKTTCTVNPLSVTPNGSSSVALTVTVTTTAASMTPPGVHQLPPPDSRTRKLVLWGLMASLALVFFRRRGAVLPPALRWGLALGTSALLILALAACGGDGGGGSVGPPANPGTPAGTSTLTVAGVVTGSPGLQHVTTVTLTVN